MRVFLQKFKSHHAQKDISEALEQFYSSKTLSEAHRAILTNHSMIVALSNRCSKSLSLGMLPHPQDISKEKQATKLGDAPSGIPSFF